MGGKHEDPKSPEDKEITGKEGGTGSTNDQHQEPKGGHAESKGKKK
ncbi:hypothetical protein OIE67_51885 [Nonomuraea fuscirosea]|nr:hypothetical protein [Nonomuraea fuscirosea]WSA52429.1 hypothetical protein OIE67_51885 [Nonomuraea fuscirosea]